MDKVRELDTFYKVIISLGFTAFIALIGFIIFILGYFIYYLWSYEDRKNRERKRILLNMKIRIDNLEKEIMKRRKK